jgi:serine phosphatase RsbU (regulator of sigma subunit)
MHSLFQHRAPASPHVVELVGTEFPAIDGAGIAAVFSGKRVAGDFYDAVRANHKRVLFGMLDVAGRREHTAEILRAAQQIFRTQGAALFAKPDINESEAMTGLCHLLNRGVQEAAGGVRSCPGFLCCYNEESGTLCYTNAGHTPGLLRDHAGVTQLPSTGLPLGLFSHATSDAPIVGVEPGAALLLVSRGVLEGKCMNHAARDPEFGLERTTELLRQDALLSPQELCTSVLNAVDSECEPVISDDRTALAFVRKA